MKLPKFVLRVGGQQFVVPHNRGLAALMSLMADAIPVHAHLYGDSPEIELAYDDDEAAQNYLTKVSIEKIPRGVKWKRKMKTGEVVEVRPVQKMSKTLETTVRHALKLAAKAQAKQLGNGSGPLQLEFGR